MLTDFAKCSFPWAGGKQHAAPLVWAGLGDVAHYCEPFAGTLAVLLRRPHLCNRPYYSETVNDADGLLCIAPETRILGSDLRWKQAGDIAEGDLLLGFDESNGPPDSVVRRLDRPQFRPPSRMRRWSVTPVIAIQRATKPSYRLVFDDGTVVVCSEDHLWLGGKGGAGGRGARWLATKTMRCDEACRSHVMKLVNVVNQGTDYDSGWLGGFFDGEGHVQGKGYGWRLSVAQRFGDEADRAVALLRSKSFDVSVQRRTRSCPQHDDCAQIAINGGMRETMRLLMLARPERLIRTAIKRAPERSIYARQRQVVGLVSKEFLGDVEVMAIETTSHTYIAEGLASHNCNAWRSIQIQPQETAEYASRPVCEADLHAIHLALVRWRQESNLERLMADPDWCDPKMAGYWLWGCCCWIGSGWCSGRGKWIVGADGRITARDTATEPGVDRSRPFLSHNGMGVNKPAIREPGVKRTIPHLSDGGNGVNKPGTREPGVQRSIPHLTDNGRGVNHAGAREPGVKRTIPHLGNDGMGVNHAGTREPGVAPGTPEHPWQEDDFHPMTMPELRAWFGFLSARLRHVRVLNGDWARLATDGAMKTLPVRQGKGVAGIFLDPPYSHAVRNDGLYAVESVTVAADVRDWCLARGDDPELRIVLAGFAGEGHEILEEHGWRVREWYTVGHLRGGYANQSANGTNQQRERLWFSPHCLDTDQAPAQPALPFEAEQSALLDGDDE